MTFAASAITPPDADRPAHYRLKDGTWEVILKEYVEGATAGFLARKWRVSEHAVRARITKHKATKRDWGDSQALSQAAAREAEFEEARRNSPEAVAARLFDGIEAPTGAEASDPAHLAQVATLASGRAMTGRLWNEAKALAGLAESYARLARKKEAEALSIDDLPARLILDIWQGKGVEERMTYACRPPRSPDDPENPVRNEYWKAVREKQPRETVGAMGIVQAALETARNERHRTGEGDFSLEDINRAEEILGLKPGAVWAEADVAEMNAEYVDRLYEEMTLHRARRGLGTADVSPR